MKSEVFGCRLVQLACARRVARAAALLLVLGACTEQGAAPPTELIQGDGADASEVGADAPDAGDARGDDDAGEQGDAAPDVVPEPAGERRADVVHSFGTLDVEPFQEVVRCVSWTLNNDEPLYLDTVKLANNGGYHHSNWFVVPEDAYPGDDGFWRCSSRDFDELEAALAGTVLFAQSTQSFEEEQRLGEGIVIKVPPRHKVVADVHLLNLSPRALETELRMTLGLVHPYDVDVVVTPFRLSYLDLAIPPRRQSRFTGDCALQNPYRRVARRDLDMKLYWVLPHYHGLGNYFNLEIVGGPRDGEVLYRLEGFNAEANGKAFDPPIDLTGAQGLRFSCGYDNPRVRSVGWGFGDQEMCVMLGFADAGALMDATVLTGTELVETDADGVEHFSAYCAAFGLPKAEGQAYPSDEERRAELYVPDGDVGDDGVDPVFGCVDTPADAVAEAPITLDSIHETVLMPSCSFSACHDASAPAAGLDLKSKSGLHERLLAHEVRADTTLALVEPGAPDRSWLVSLLSKCEPVTADGTVVAHMPQNSPELLAPGVVAKVAAWVEAGAQP